jgi:hypothetical protein
LGVLKSREPGLSLVLLPSRLTFLVYKTAVSSELTDRGPSRGFINVTFTLDRKENPYFIYIVRK